MVIKRHLPPLPPPHWPETTNLLIHISFISGVFCQAQKTGVYIKIITPGWYVF